MAKLTQRRKDRRVARARARAKYGPERSTLKAQLGDFRRQYQSDVAGAESSAKSSIHFARKAAAPMAAIYDASQGIAEGARQDVEAAFGKLGAAADPYRAVTAREREGAAARLASERAGALRDLQDRQLEAVAGRQYARTQARSELLANTQKLRGQQRDLNRRMGDYISQEMAAIAEGRAKRKADTRGIRLRGQQQTALEDQKQANRVALEGVKAKNRADGGGSGLPKGVKPASRSELRMFKSDFARALNEAKNYPSRAAARAELISGAPAYKDPKTNETIPAAPSIDDQLALSAALDMHFDKHVSRANARQMRSQGIRVRDLPGAVSYKRWRRTRTPGLSSGGGGGPRGAGRL